MAWTAPLTAVASATFTAAQYNTHCRNNFLEMEPAKATGKINSQETFCLMMTSTAAPNQIVERSWAHHTVEASESTTSTSYTKLTTLGPSVTITTGTAALVWFGSHIENNTADAASFVSVEVSGASTVAASNEWCIEQDGHNAGNAVRRSMFKHFTGLTAGSNRFTMQYKVGSNTGTFNYRHMAVWAM